MDRSRLRWQCRRGMKELDHLLIGYLNTRFDDAAEEEKAAFQALLELPDPELIAYLLGKEEPPGELAGVVGRIRSTPPG